MDGIKNFVASRTVWAAVIGFMVMLAGTFNLDLGADQTSIVDAIMKVVEGASFLLAIIFRVVATKKLLP